MTRQLRNLPRTILIVLAFAVPLAVGYYVSTRWVKGNFHVVVPNRVYRSAQPSADQITRWAIDHEIRTIFNLRNEEDPGLVATESLWACLAGVEFLHLPLSDRSLPVRSEFLRLITALEIAAQPILIHCRAGADRTGVLSVLAAMAVGGATYDEARSQLSFRYLHFGDDPNAVEGVLTKYEAHCRRHGRTTGGWREYRDWAFEHYSDTYYLVEIKAPQRIHARPGQTIEVDLTIRNRTDITIPVEDPDKTFSVAAYMGTAVAMMPEKEFSPRTRLVRSVPPEGSVSVSKTLTAPAKSGTYVVHFDLIEEHFTWFAAQGSPEIPRQLVVAAHGGSGDQAVGSSMGSRRVALPIAAKNGSD